MAFTLVELVAVIAIIALLMALLLPAIQSAREAARRIQCANHMKQLGVSLHSYHQSNGMFPPAGFYHGSTLSWHTAILPHIEQAALYDLLDQAGPYYSNLNKRVALNRVAIFLCPSSSAERSVLFSWFKQTADRIDGQDTYTYHYQGILGPVGVNPVTGALYRRLDIGTHAGFALEGTMLHDRGISIAHIRDGASMTYLVGELSWDDSGVYRSWARGTDVMRGAGSAGSAKNINYSLGLMGYRKYGFQFNDASFGSQHLSGGYFARADGSVHYVTDEIDIGVYKAMASRKGGEAVGP